MKRRGRQASGLAGEDQRLWRNVTKTVSPLEKRDVRTSDVNQGFDVWDDWVEEQGLVPQKLPEPAVADPHKAVATEPTSSTSTRDKGRVTKAPLPQIRTSTVSTPSTIERPTHRKLAKGRLPIDATLDLHHMTQDQAHQRLLSFVTDGFNRGHRHVLVITGKGMSLNSQGVLKKMLPVWLSMAPFVHMVSGLRHASRDHGGEGAWYIRLKKRKQPHAGQRQ